MLIPILDPIEIFYSLINVAHNRKNPEGNGLTELWYLTLISFPAISRYQSAATRYLGVPVMGTGNGAVTPLPKLTRNISDLISEW